MFYLVELYVLQWNFHPRDTFPNQGRCPLMVITQKKKRTTRTGLYKVDWNQYVKPLLPLMQAFTTLEKYGQKVEQQSGYTE